jgi:glutaredoxin
MIFELIRWPLGQLVLAIDFLTRPQRPQRPAALQQTIDAQTRGLALYQFKACPFCVKARRAMRRLGVDIPLRDASGDPTWRDQLEREGGKIQVPCLYIPGADGAAEWLYESDAIIRYLTERVAAVEAPAAS